MAEKTASIQRAMVERAASIQRAMVERAASIQRAMVERAASIQRAMVERVASIQRGRWHYIFYKGKVEDELHFVFRCQLHETLPERANLLQFC